MDAALEMKKFETLINCLKSVAVQKLGVETDLDSLDLIKQYFKENHEFVTSLTDTQRIYIMLQNEMSNTVHLLKAKILIAELSVLNSLLLVRVMVEINSVDHVERNILKVKYIEEDVQMFEALLNNYYFHGLVTGTIIDTNNIRKPSQITSEMYTNEEVRSSLKKVHPYCAIILDMKEETAKRVGKYALGNTFRPDEPSYTSFVKVSIINLLSKIKYITSL